MIAHGIDADRSQSHHLRPSAVERGDFFDDRPNDFAAARVERSTSGSERGFGFTRDVVQLAGLHGNDGGGVRWVIVFQFKLDNIAHEAAVLSAISTSLRSLKPSLGMT